MTGPTTGQSSGAGFTLLEMTLVVLIIGLLATLVVPRVLGRTTAARQARATAELEIIAQALEGYRLDAGVYPTTAQGLDALVRTPVLPPVPPRWRPDGYLPSVPRDPWANAYDYACSDGRHFVLRSFGADHAPGGEGENADVDRDAS
jgi:general secretion pathway protein G